MNVIPAIDLSDGACVRLFQGDFEEKTVYSRDPLAVAQGFEREGAEWLHVVDLDGAKDGASAQTSLVRRIVEGTGLRVQTGGGIRTEAQVTALIESGVERVVVGSLVVEAPDVVREWLARFGPERIVLAIDVRIQDGVPRPQTRGWQDDSDLSLWDLLARFDVRPSRGATVRHVLCTDIARDGTLEGPNLRLYRELARRFPDVRVIASGGVRELDDLRSLKRARMAGVVVGKALFEGRFRLSEALSC